MIDVVSSRTLEEASQDIAGTVAIWDGLPWEKLGVLLKKEHDG